MKSEINEREKTIMQSNKKPPPELCIVTTPAASSPDPLLPTIITSSLAIFLNTLVTIYD
ncbi:hypothetical protein CCACVL1_09373 [Corchorus capsularis]|uniref:Uncharacterized protein n=1 Tax=Corchorus capsularis TaxID=210143 RepID=A0A1R3IWH6_COCAP|nr:hypothetical protein CCACVL1_09373 [Corchorus capsularis]